MCVKRISDNRLQRADGGDKSPPYGVGMQGTDLSVPLHGGQRVAAPTVLQNKKV